MVNFGGKLVGFVLGLVFAGPTGAVLGFILGFMHDNNKNKPSRLSRSSWSAEDILPKSAGSLERSTYAVGVIVLGAKMAKADGCVSRAEIAAFKRVFRVQESESAEVGKIFDTARQSSQGFEPYAMRLSQVFRRNPVILEEILTGLFIVAASDTGGVLSFAEAKFLGQVATLFNFSQADFVRIAARSGVRLPEEQTQKTQKLLKDKNYDVLGLQEDASPEVIKKAYRSLIRKHHPDKMLAQGMPAEFVEQATEKMKRINAAYAAICKVRGIR